MKLMEKKDVKNKLANVLDQSHEEIDLTLSYSKLSDFDRNGAISLVRKSKVDNNGVKLGSLVDDLLFNDAEYIKSTYYQFDGEKPTATLGSLVDIVIKDHEEVPNVEEILKIIALNKFWSNIKKVDVLTSNFDKPEFWKYIKGVSESQGRVLVTTREYNDAMELVSILKTHPYSTKLLNNDHQNIYQLKFELKYRRFNIRGIIDIASIDHKNKTIYLTDLKTGKNVSTEFYSSFVKWRYYMQAAIYTLAFKEICEHFKLEGYTLAPFQFLYISKSDKIPLVYTTSEKWIEAAFKGFKLEGVDYKGINDLLDEIYWCWKNKEYNIPMSVAENNGNVELNDKYINVNE